MPEDDDEFSMDNTAKLQYLINLGFPDHDKIYAVLMDVQWDLNAAYWILITDLAENVNSDSEAEEVRKCLKISHT